MSSVVTVVAVMVCGRHCRTPSVTTTTTTTTTTIGVGKVRLNPAERENNRSSFSVFGWSTLATFNVKLDSYQAPSIRPVVAVNFSNKSSPCAPSKCTER